jgi:hypothetical protein
MEKRSKLPSASKEIHRKTPTNMITVQFSIPFAIGLPVALYTATIPCMTPSFGLEEALYHEIEPGQMCLRSCREL